MTLAELTALLDKPDWTEAECRLVLDYLEAGTVPELATLLQERFEKGMLKTSPDDAAKAGQLLNNLHGRMNIPSAPVRFLRGRTWWAAASIIILLAAGIYFWNENHKGKPDVAIKPATNDISPGGNKAILTLSGGRQIILDSTAGHTLAKQGNITISKPAGGQLKYEGTDQAVYMNTLTTPRGGQYQLILPDGTHVWLNAASSIIYPTAFAGDERKVTVSGEVYFEVAKDKTKPFRVHVNDMTVEVLGTHFNVNSYPDEPDIRITLLEGSVKINKETKSEVLKPGEQAIADDAGMRKTSDVDLDQVMAWQQGLFVFNNANLPRIMRQISRWYDVDLVYERKQGDAQFGGGISKNLPLSNVLKLLEANGIQSRLEGKKLYVQ